MGDIVITPASNDVNSTAGTLVLRSSDLNPISLRTNDTNRLFIDPTGSVGLGTAVPTGGLHINYAPGAFSEALRLQRNGGIFYYQEEFVPCGNAFVANANMNIAGSKIFSEGGAWSELLGFPGYVATSFNIPCVGGLIFTGAATAKISGGIPLLYAPNSTNPGAIAMAGERIGNGYVILSGDSNLVQFSSSSWTEFLRRLLTLDQIL